MTQALVWTDDRAELLAEADERYQLAADDGTVLLTFGEADDAGVAWLADEPEGWAAPEVDLPLDAKPDGHGAFSGEQSYSERVLTVAGSAEAPTLAAARQARQRLVTALTSTVRTGGDLLWTHLDDLPAKSLRVHLNGRPNVRQSGRWLDYSFVLVADDPVKHGPLAVYGPVRLVSSASEPGRTYPRTYPRAYPASTTSLTVAQVANAGDEPAQVVYTINGPVPRPIVQLSNGAFTALALDLAAGDVAVIDTDAGAVEVNGVNRYDAFGLGSTFPMIPPGGVEVRLRSATGGTDQAAGLVITTAPRWT